MRDDRFLAGPYSISDLCIYPIKSCGGISVSEAPLSERGLAGDRRWMIVDDEGLFITQRSEPRLAAVDLEIAPDGWLVHAAGSHMALPSSHEGPKVSVEVWSSHLDACRHAMGSTFFSEFLGRKASLVYMPDDAHRPIKRWEGVDLDGQLSFADGYPLLLVGTASLTELNRRLAEPVTMARFRPNVVVATEFPHEEDQWREIRLGPVPAIHTKRCDRCSMVTIDQSCAFSKEPLRTLATYRREGGKVWFGVNLAHQGSGTLRVGDFVVA